MDIKANIRWEPKPKRVILTQHRTPCKSDTSCCIRTRFLFLFISLRNFCMYESIFRGLLGGWDWIPMQRGEIALQIHWWILYFAARKIRVREWWRWRWWRGRSRRRIRKERDYASLKVHHNFRVMAVIQRLCIVIHETLSFLWWKLISWLAINFFIFTHPNYLFLIMIF